MKFSTRGILALAVMLLLSAGVFAQKGFFKTISPTSAMAKGVAAKSIKKSSFLQLNEQALRTYLLPAPLEFKNRGKTMPLEIPLPDGTTETFKMVESPVLSDVQAALHPEIKTYTGNGTADKKLVIRISLTSEGFNAIILNVHGSEAIYIEKLSGNVYFGYFTRDAVEGKRGINNSRNKPLCGVTADQQARKLNRNFNDLQRPSQVATTSGTVLRTFRLSMSGSAEYTAKHGGTVAGGFAGIVSITNRLKALYRNELAVDFTLVSGTNLVYTDGATDPFTTSDDIAMLGENQTVTDNVIGSANYDVGFVLNGNPDGTSPSGVAYFQSICDNNYKAGGVANEGDGNYYSTLYSDKTLFHEMGHKFGMSHSYNSSIPVCTTREQPTSVEPGSGATLMSYGFKCNDETGNDDYFESTTIGLLLHFHSASYDQAVTYMSTLVGGTSVATGNTPPVITMPPAYTIPKSTPFYLTGSATDADNDELTFSWEGTNVGPIADPGPNWFLDPSKAPFFRTFDPVNTGTRVYPQLDSILNNDNVSRANKLPSVSVVTTHSLTVRDNNAAGGGVTNASVSITVDGAIGPFLVTSNNSTASYAALSSQTVTWSVNGTNAATPNVKISLSADGGQTFPFTLAANTANDGTEVVTIPNNQTTTARIKVESIGNIFFDISNADFTITAPVVVNYNIVASSGVNGTVTPAGTTSVTSGADQTYTITPNSCYAIEDVLVDGVSVGAVATYTFTGVTAAHTISATFSQLSYSITATSGANGTITQPGATSVSCGANQTYTIAANSCYVIADVLVDGSSVGAVGTYTFTGVTATHTISATFSLRTYSISATSGANGTVTPAGATSVNCGANQTYTITANSCYAIADVLVDGISVGAVGTYTFTGVTAPHTISASFSQLSYTITATSGANGTVTPAGATNVNCGTNQTYTITANAGYSIASVIVDGLSIGAVGSYTFSSVTAPHTISATFVIAAGCTTPVLAVSATNVSCKGSSTGAVNLTVTAGSAPFTYSWTGPNGFTAATEDISAVKAGSYSVKVTATGGCFATISATVNEPAAALVVNPVYAAIQCAGSKTTVDVRASGGTVPYTGTGFMTNQFAGSRTYSVTDASGCTASTTIVIADGTGTGPAAQTITGTFSVTKGQTNVDYSVPCVAGQTYTWVVPAGATVTSGAGTCAIKVTFGASAVSGNIKVTVNNACGTTNTSKYITVSGTAGCVTPVLNVSATNVSCKGSSTGAVNLTVTAGSAPFTYSWTGPNGFTAATEDISAVKAGAYSVKATATGGCFATISATVTEPAAALVVNPVYSAIQCAGSKTTVDVRASGGTAPYTGTGFMTNQFAGSRTYSVTDASGCTASTTIVIADGTGTGPAAQTITGTFSVTKGQTNVDYSVPCVAGQTYTWVVPAGATVASGQGTCAAKVTFGASAVSGNIKVTVNNACGTTNTSKYITVNAAPPVSPKQALYTATEQPYFRVYPNPVSGSGTFIFSSEKRNQQYEIRISTLTGKTVYTKNGVTVAGENKFAINTSNFVSGLYQVTLFTNSTTQTIKLVKAN